MNVSRLLCDLFVALLTASLCSVTAADNTMNAAGRNTAVLQGKRLQLTVLAPDFVDGPKGDLNTAWSGKGAEGNGLTEYSARFNAPLPSPGAGLSFIVKLWEVTKANENIRVDNLDRLAELTLMTSGLTLQDASRIESPKVEGADTVGYQAYGAAYGDEYYGRRVAYIIVVRYRDGKAAYALSGSMLTSYADTTQQAYKTLTALDGVYQAQYNQMLDFIVKEKPNWWNVMKTDKRAKETAALCAINGYAGQSKPTCAGIVQHGVAYGGLDAIDFYKATDKVLFLDPSKKSKSEQSAKRFVLGDADYPGYPPVKLVAQGALRSALWLIQNTKVDIR